MKPLGPNPIHDNVRSVEMLMAEPHQRDPGHGSGQWASINEREWSALTAG